jgi:hypothetical protein
MEVSARAIQDWEHALALARVFALEDLCSRLFVPVASNIG